LRFDAFTLGLNAIESIEANLVDEESVSDSDEVAKWKAYG